MPEQNYAQTNAAEQMTVIGADTRIKGEMFFEKSARILGQFEGKIAARGEVQIGVGALCNAAVEASRVIVDGGVCGPITAREQITLTANAQVKGDLTAATLVVAEGASFVGHCNVGPKAKELANDQPVARPRVAGMNEPKPAAPSLVGTGEDEFRPPWQNTTPLAG
jgi:cytoskeletal protein CcmA (bactofilin family)